jgi:hypothetical protein
MGIYGPFFLRCPHLCPGRTFSLFYGLVEKGMITSFHLCLVDLYIEVFLRRTPIYGVEQLFRPR